MWTCRTPFLFSFIKPALGALLLIAMIALLPLLLAAQVAAYIPASPTNSSQDAIAGGLNMTDISKLRLRWFSDGYAFFIHTHIHDPHSSKVTIRKMYHISLLVTEARGSAKCAAVGRISFILLINNRFPSGHSHPFLRRFG